MRTAIVTLLVVAAFETSVFGDSVPEPTTVRADGAWSKPVNNLSARLLLSLEELPHEAAPSTYRYVAVVEVKNIGSEVVALSSQPSFTGITVCDADGKPVAECGYIQDGTVPAPQWAHVPGNNTYLGVRVDMTTVLPLKGSRRDSALLAIDDNVYSLAPGRYSLRATLHAKNDVDGPENQWLGEIKLEEVSFSFKSPEH